MQKHDLINDRGAGRCSECERRDDRVGDTCEIPRYVKCGCGEPINTPSNGLKGYSLASVYSVLQDWQEIYDLDAALKRGTIFKELDLPFCGSCCSVTDGRYNDARRYSGSDCRCGDGRIGGGKNGR